MNFSWAIHVHKEIIYFLQNSIINESTVQAYLFLGPPNLGKSLTAKFFASSLFCTSDNRPCQQCFNCKSLTKNLHPDFYAVNLLPEKNSIGIEQIRELISHLCKRPTISNLQLAVIESADKMTVEAGNALLKTLEEPTKQTKIILLSDQDNLLPTIKSRCQLIKFRPLGQGAMTEFIGQQKISEALNTILLTHSVNGRIGLAYELLSDAQAAKEFLNSLYGQLEIGRSDLARRFKEAERIAVDRQSQQKNLSFWQIILKLIIRKKIDDLVTKQLEIDQQINFYANKSWPEILKISRFLEKIPDLLNHNVNPRLIWENFFLTI